MRLFLSLRVLDAPLSRDMTRVFSVIPGRSQDERTRNLEIPDQPAELVIGPRFARTRWRPVRNDLTSDSGDFDHQIGQPLGGVESSGAAGG
jgi:hypothetical protein